MQTIYYITVNGHLAPVVPSEFMTIAILRAEQAGLTNYRVEEK